MELWLFQALHGLAGKNLFGDRIAIFLAHDLIFVVGLLLFVPWIWKKAVPQGLVSAGAAFGINAIAGMLFFRPRPFVTLHFDPLVSAVGKSFPSDHTAIACALATILFLIDRRLGSIAWICALLIGISRVVVGVHYPFDILGGIIVGTLSAYFVSRIFYRRAVV